MLEHLQLNYVFIINIDMTWGTGLVTCLDKIILKYYLVYILKLICMLYTPPCTICVCSNVVLSFYSFHYIYQNTTELYLFMKVGHDISWLFISKLNYFLLTETKDQWARDDPAFLVLLSFWLFGMFLIFPL